MYCALPFNFFLHKTIKNILNWWGTGWTTIGPHFLVFRVTMCGENPLSYTDVAFFLVAEGTAWARVVTLGWAYPSCFLCLCLCMWQPCRPSASWGGSYTEGREEDSLQGRCSNLFYWTWFPGLNTTFPGNNEVQLKEPHSALSRSCLGHFLFHGAVDSSKSNSAWGSQSQSPWVMKAVSTDEIWLLMGDKVDKLYSFVHPGWVSPNFSNVFPEWGCYDTLLTSPVTSF